MNDPDFVQFVLDQLHPLGGGVEARSMFGGHGLYRGELFFGIIHDGQLYLRTDDGSRGEYVRRGMGPFRPNAKQTIKNYYEVPADVIDRPDLLTEWSRRALTAAAARPKGRQKSRRRPSPKRK